MPWTIEIQRMEKALAETNVSAATRAWHAAYRAALKSPGWAGLVQVGEAHLRIGDIAGDRRAFEPEARQIYLTALSRARHQDSLDGVLEVAEAFDALGDRQLVEQALQIADLLAAQDAEAEADLEAFRQKVTEPPPAPGDHDLHGSPTPECPR